MNTTDYIVNVILSVFLIVGVYQFYFWCQRNSVTEPRLLKFAIDDWIPYQPGWVWIYSCLYYPVILYINLVVKSQREFTYVAISYMILLSFHMLFFVLFPVTTPEHMRTCNGQRNLSERFLAFVQRIDQSSNCFPSMHTSVAVLTALHLQPKLGPWAWAFPALISLSCLFTKQHYLIDLPAGAVLGWIAYEVFRRIV